MHNIETCLKKTITTLIIWIKILLFLLRTVLGQHITELVYLSLFYESLSTSLLDNAPNKIVGCVIQKRMSKWMRNLFRIRHLNVTVPLQLDFLREDDVWMVLLEVEEPVHLLDSRLQCLYWKVDKTWKLHAPKHIDVWGLFAS